MPASTRIRISVDSAWSRFALARLCGALALLAAIALPGVASAANVLEKSFYMTGPRYEAVLPGCDAALGTIQSRFATKEGRFWNSDLQIIGFEHVRQVAFRPWVESSVPRRFCTARALVSDGRIHTVHFSLIEDGGEIGASYGVEWCVVGLDRNWAYNPSCRAARP